MVLSSVVIYKMLKAHVYTHAYNHIVLFYFLKQFYLVAQADLGYIMQYRLETRLELEIILLPWPLLV